MKKISEFNSSYRTVVGGLAAAVSPLLLDGLKSYIPDHTMSYTLMLLMMTVGLVLVGSVGEGLVDRSAGVRKFICGDDHVEGYWYDVTIDETTLKAKHGVLINIGFEEGGYNISGETFDPAGSSISTFNSVKAIYEDRTLFCQYVATTKYFKEGTETGVMELRFFRPPTSYTGYYFDYTQKLKATVTGKRVGNGDLENSSFFESWEARAQFMVKVIEKEEAGVSKGNRAK